MNSVGLGERGERGRNFEFGGERGGGGRGRRFLAVGRVWASVWGHFGPFLSIFRVLGHLEGYFGQNFIIFLL